MYLQETRQRTEGKSVGFPRGLEGHCGGDGGGSAGLGKASCGGGVVSTGPGG
jgi:hypothetical protein